MKRAAPVLEPPRRDLGSPFGPGGPRVTTGDGGGSAEAGRPPLSAASILVWLLMVSVTVLFASFTSTLLARRAEADWRPGPLPSVMWAGTAVLAASSAAVEWARRGGRRHDLARLRRGLAGALGLGLAFLGLQAAAWRQLAAMGIYLATNPHSAFVYLLTGLHGLHLLGGLAALGYALRRARRGRAAAAAMDTVDPTAVFWHFLTVLWLYLFTILSTL